MAKREVNIFNIAFLDLLSGALAAVLILFIVVPKMDVELVEEIEELRKLELEVDEVKDMVEELKNSVPKDVLEDLEKKFDALENKIAEMEETISKLRKKIEDLEEENRELKAKVIELEERIKELEAQLAKCETEKAELEAENSRMMAEIDDLKRTNKELEQRAENAERALSITKKLDIVFVMDCTSSMKDEIEDLKANLVGIVRILQRTVESVHIGFIAFRDIGDEYVTKPFSITDTESGGLNRLITFVNGLSAAGGGDDEEAVQIAMREADGLNWRSGVKQVMVIIGDAAAHAEDVSTCNAIATSFNARPGEAKVSVVYAAESDKYVDFFQKIASLGGGEFVKDKGRMMESILLSVMD